MTVGPADPLGDRARLGGVGREAVVGDRDARALDDLAGLVLVEPHTARDPIRRARDRGPRASPPAGASPPLPRSADARQALRRATRTRCARRPRPGRGADDDGAGRCAPSGTASARPRRVERQADGRAASASRDARRTIPGDERHGSALDDAGAATLGRCSPDDRRAGAVDALAPAAPALPIGRRCGEIGASAVARQPLAVACHVPELERRRRPPAPAPRPRAARRDGLDRAARRGRRPAAPLNVRRLPAARSRPRPFRRRRPAKRDTLSPPTR